MSNDPLMTVRQLAAREGVSEDTVRRWIRRDGLPHYKAGGIRVRCSAFRAWISGRLRVLSAAG
jgi:excisionase family DNA binding protein